MSSVVVTRLAILADVHLSASPDDPRAAILRRAVDEVTAARPDEVLLLGDTVEYGEAEEYAHGREILGPLPGKLTAVPGNHELLRGDLDDFRRAWGTEPATTGMLGDVPVLRLNSGVGNQSEEEYFGRIDAQGLGLLDAGARRHARDPLLVFSHHPLANTVRRSEEFNFALANSEELRGRLERRVAPVVLFSAHTHYQSVVRFGHVTCIGCPPLGYWPHAFVMVEIDAGVLRFETRRIPCDVTESPDQEAGDAGHRTRAEGQAADRSGTVDLTVAQR